MLEKVRRLWEHVVWADTRILDALQQSDRVPAEAVQEHAHVLGAEEVWLARLEQRSPRAAVWPVISLAELKELVQQTHAGFAGYLSGLHDADLDRTVTYANSAGDKFSNSIGDILLHVCLHGQYHRGKVNLLLRQSGCDPVPADYIAFVRGIPAPPAR